MHSSYINTARIIVTTKHTEQMKTAVPKLSNTEFRENRTAGTIASTSMCFYQFEQNAAGARRVDENIAVAARADFNVF